MVNDKHPDTVLHQDVEYKARIVSENDDGTLTVEAVALNNGQLFRVRVQRADLRAGKPEPKAPEAPKK